MAGIRKSIVMHVAVAFLVIMGTGLAAGWLLLRYDESLGFAEEADRIAEVLHLRPGLTVADVRSGSGTWTADIARRIGNTGQVYATVGPTYCVVFRRPPVEP